MFVHCKAHALFCCIMSPELNQRNMIIHISFWQSLVAGTTEMLYCAYDKVYTPESCMSCKSFPPCIMLCKGSASKLACVLARHPCRNKEHWHTNKVTSSCSCASILCTHSADTHILHMVIAVSKQSVMKAAHVWQLQSAISAFAMTKMQSSSPHCCHCAGVAHINPSYQITKIEIFYDPHELMVSSWFTRPYGETTAVVWHAKSMPR